MPSVFLAALGIVIGLPVTLGIFSDIYTRLVAFKEREMELLSRQTAEKTAQYVAHNERLEQRVRVLERLVTDSGTDLALRIEALRGTEVN